VSLASPDLFGHRTLHHAGGMDVQGISKVALERPTWQVRRSITAMGSAVFYYLSVV